MGYRILIADDEKDIRQLLRDYFEMQGFFVMTAGDGSEAIKKSSMEPDIILLDIAMPKLNGLEVCQRIRMHVSCPILFLTARITEQDRINGLVIGGDDYIQKPFSIDELGARVMAHLRREARNASREKVHFTGALTLNLSERCAYCKRESLPLTRTEFDILELLCMNKGQVFSKERIYEKLWGYDGEGESSIVTEHIRRIRLKLSKYIDQPLIETVWGVGYKWIG